MVHLREKVFKPEGGETPSVGIKTGGEEVENKRVHRPGDQRMFPLSSGHVAAFVCLTLSL